MSRVINVNSPGKRRNQNMRSGAELIRHLSSRQNLDDETRDMLAALLFVLRDIDKGLEESTDAWERRDYWIKAEHFRQRWAWVGKNARKLEKIMREEQGEQLPVFLVEIVPHFSDIKVVKFTRDSSLWKGVYARLREEWES